MRHRSLFASIIALLLAAISVTPVQAQIEQGGVPFSFSRAEDLPEPALVQLQEVDLAALSAEDAVNDNNKSIPYRFGYNHIVDLGVGNSGTWTTLDDGTRVWRLAIACPGAISINFEFDAFEIASGAKVFVLDESGQHIGAFTNANDPGTHVLGVQPVRGERITVEYSVPPRAGLGRLHIGQVTHGYRDVFKFARGLGDSGACNNNVICPEGAPWADQIRSVAMIVVSGSGICTGTLINNCASNGTPYFLTANHCLPGNLNVSTWVFRFNWNSPTCSPTTNGPTNQTVSGASLLANNAGSDVALLQLSSAPPANYGVYYSGWDRSGTAPTNTTCIHHPQADIKKISFDYNAATTATYGSAACWRIAAWDDGTTEPGSSGSGLWDQNKRLIGQLYGGEATCSNNVNDYFGRFAVSYASLQTWLGSCGNTVNGYDPNTPTLSLDAQVTGITGASGNTCATQITPSVTVRNGGTTTLTSFSIAWSITGGGSGTVPWTGSLTSGNSVSVPIGAVTLPAGYLMLTATVNAPNGGTDQALGNNTGTSNITTGPNTLTLQLNLDRYGAETTWVIRNGVNILASGGPYTNQAGNGVYPQPPIVVCVPDGCHELVVYDSFGDGMCCAYGAGNFQLRDAQNNVLASNSNFTGSSTTHAFCVTAAIGVAPKIFLEGPYGTGPTMTDALRAGGLIPATEPYTGMAGFTHVGGGGGETINAGVLATTGNNAIVDWVFVQLRSTAGGYPVVATRSALVQRDGDVVGMDGSSPVQFAIAAGNYHVAIRHRNHLGIMTANPVALTGSPTTVNFTSAATATYGTEARKDVSGVQVMWAGNVNGDTQLLYVGSGNDRDPILVRIGGSVPTANAAGYYIEDVNMNGTVLYVGSGNDRDPILVNIGGSIPTNNRQQQLP
ncbi:MAG: trypsin-like peptidase domain-containing protein [Flavobacteriales bacterium]|nr:trypsin-like peptidase domain-containing protein [Flavobacteriales bacterium]